MAHRATTWLDRRALLAGLGVLAAPRIARAQSPRAPARIGVLGLAPTADIVGAKPRSPSTVAFIAGLRDLGYVYGQHYVVEARGADARSERFPALVAEILRQGVDVIVAAGPALPALRDATSTVPVVMAASPDPIAQGLAKSLRRPDRNFTGMSLQSVEITAKRLELLRELAPGAAAMGVVWNVRGAGLLNWQAAEAAGRERRWKVVSLQIDDASGIDGAFKSAAQQGIGSLLVFAAGDLFPHARRVADLAARHRMPAMYELREFVDAGGLASYGPSITGVWRRAAFFTDRILKGVRPAELPIEQPSEFELVINLKTADALGLPVPPSLRTRAVEVIE